MLPKDLRDMVQTLGNMVQTLHDTLHDTLVSPYNYTDFRMMIHHHSFWKTAHLFKQMTQTQGYLPMGSQRQRRHHSHVLNLS